MTAGRDASARGRDDRSTHVAAALERSDFAALVCALPLNVLSLTGYWPVVGPACAVVSRGGATTLLVPDDERDRAADACGGGPTVVGLGAADPLRAIHDVLGGTVPSPIGRVGVEYGLATEPSSYVAMRLLGGSLRDLVTAVWPRAVVTSADELLAELRAHVGPAGLARIAAACELAGRAFAAGGRALRPGMRETDLAARVRAPLSVDAAPTVGRADGFVFCMTGVNGAEAYRSYARSTATPIADGDLVLVHCNSYIDGYWTDITRTYCVGEPDDRQRAMYDAVFAGRRAGLAAIQPGVTGGAVDAAVRDTLAAHGFGPAFRHSTGHGVGFGAIDHDARPRLAPRSTDRLAPGMVCNVEPAIYLDGYGGLRHCDMVEVTTSGARVLTPFLATIGDLTVHPR